jgi:hypothetical protein
MVFLTVELCCHALLEKAVLIQLEKYILSDIGLELGCCAAKAVKANIKPVVYCGMNRVILVAKLLRRALLNYGSCFRCRTVSIRA